ncbi:ATP-binding cassette domain-containing protein [Flaviflexus equikiangi]|uniref:ATP-binding cassette domain-containing protein n=1 Tax=Flaviflexus equikiangi TaxID=2758573 RepID=A0ABS2TIE9_9ACTO|nr:ATP-binding cassette domain-containing protein [Flaviflexus equikiangi]MBM9434133.1 ATP-binding cassette domain-containing protein [Flaviflexus equikiangi]
MTYSVTFTNASYSYGKKPAVRDVTATIAPGTITGLLGRNGSGKSTLAMMMCGHLKARGTVLVDGDSPWENPTIMPNAALVSDATSIFLDSKLARTHELWRALRPHWSEDLYRELMDQWGLRERDTYSSLSRGQQSAFTAALGLASRSPLTIFDEVHLGMDVVVRHEFYDTMLAEFVNHPRTIVLSSHLVGEIENLVSDVLILDRGTVAAAGAADDVRAAHGTDGTHASLTDVLISLTGRTKK